MNLIFYLFLTTYCFIGTYFLFYSFYWSYLSILSIFYQTNQKLKNDKDTNLKINKLLILFPAYQPNLRLIEAVTAAKNVYTNHEIEILVILQDDIENIKDKLDALEVSIIEKTFKHTKGNPYHEVLRFSANEAKHREASHILLLDKDNIVAENFIEIIENFGNNKADVWQGKRVAINSSTKSSIYDGISEKLNDALLREAKQTMGLPPELSGSALLFKTDAFYEATINLDTRAPGMDKNLLIQLLLLDKKISYVPSAIVSEEKTDSNEVIKKQRMRWFGNQYFNAFYWGKALLLKGKIATIDYCITLYRPPRSIQMVILPILTIFEFILPFYYLFTVSTLFTYTAIFIFILKENIWLESIKIASTLPKIALNNLQSALKGSAKNQQGKFISTKRETTNNDRAA